MAEMENREQTDLDTLNYLHDAHVLGIEIDQDLDGRRVIQIHTACHPDSEYPAWTGRKITVILDGVVTARHFIAGYTDCRDEISGWESEISQEMKAEIEKLKCVGLRCDGISFEVTFQSGSRLEGVCEGLYVSVGGVVRTD